jgi:hypothetical protein
MTIEERPKWFVFKWNPIGYIEVYVKIFHTSKEEAWGLIPLLFEKHYKNNEFDIYDFKLLDVDDEYVDCYYGIPENDYEKG